MATFEVGDKVRVTEDMRTLFGNVAFAKGQQVTVRAAQDDDDWYLVTDDSGGEMLLPADNLAQVDRYAAIMAGQKGAGE